jgi:hypothetical protein
MSLTLRNPHSVLAVLDTRPKDVIDIVLPPKASNDYWEQVAKKARDHKVPVLTGQPRSQKPIKPTKPFSHRPSPNDESSRMGIAAAHIRE